MSLANVHSTENIELKTSSGPPRSSPNTSVVPFSASSVPASLPTEEDSRGMRRRNAISVASGQTAEAAIEEAAVTISGDTVISDARPAPSPAKIAQLPTSDDAIMIDADADPAFSSSPGSHAHARSSAEPPLASNSLVLPQTSMSLSDRFTPSNSVDGNTTSAQQLEHEDKTFLTPKASEKVIRTVNAKGRPTGGVVIFANLTPSRRSEILQSEDLSLYVVDAPPLPGQTETPEPSSWREKGKGKATDMASSSSCQQTEAVTTPRDRGAPDSYAARKISSSVERRVANYAVTHPPGWFDDLPPINEDLFKDSPHKEYKMVLIHTARCNVCLQYNKGTLFMCADCTVSICEGCADGKAGFGVGDDAGGEDVEMTEGDVGGEEDADATTFAAAEGANVDYNVGPETAGEAGGGAERKLDWCGPYHEVFRAAYLEWKAAKGGRDLFVSTEGIEFKTSPCKQGGRKRKAT